MATQTLNKKWLNHDLRFTQSDFKQDLKNTSQTDFFKAKKLIEDNNVFIVCHYYCDPLIQQLTQQCNGFIGDSLEMAKACQKSKASNILVCGVRFIGQSVKTICPKKNIFMPDLSADCSLNLSINYDSLSQYKKEHKDTVVVSYINTSYKIKSLCDFIVTSSIAKQAMDDIGKLGKKILFVPDKNLGSYVGKDLDSDVSLWPGYCVVHNEFSANEILKIKNKYTNAQIAAHPESGAEVLSIADFIGSTSQIINFCKESKYKEFIIVIEENIIFMLENMCKDKTFIKPNFADNSILKGSCPWMRYNTLSSIIDCFDNSTEHEVKLDLKLQEASKIPLERMLMYASGQDIQQVLQYVG